MKDSVVMTFARMNPPTIGHQKLVDIVKLEAGKRGAEPQIYLSHTQDKKKNPLDYNTKIKVAQSAFGPAVKKTGHKQIIDILKMMAKRGVKNVVMVVGSDRVPEFDRILNKYNGKDFTFDSVRVISAGQRDPDAEGVEGMSASKIRSLAVEGDFNAFKAGLAKGLSSAEAKKIYNKVRVAMEDIEIDDAELDLFLESVEYDEEELIEAPLTIQQRLKKSRQMRRLAPKIKRRRELLKKKMASPDKLQKRSRKAAIKFLKKKFAGKLGGNYANLSSSQKIAVDRLVQKKMKDVGVVAKRLLPKIRKKEQERLKKMRSQKNEELQQRFQKEISEMYYDPEHMEQRRRSRTKKMIRGKDLRRHFDPRMREEAGIEEKIDRTINQVLPRQLKDKKKEMMVVKNKKVIVIDRNKWKEYEKKGYKLAEQVDEESGPMERVRTAIAREKRSDRQKWDRMRDRARIKDARSINRQTRLSTEARNPHPMGTAIKEKQKETGKAVKEENLDELDTATLQQYKTKADKDIDRRFKKSVTDDSEENKRKIANRAKGYARASTRLMNPSRNMTRKANEEVEQVDEVSRKTLRSYIGRAEKDVQHNRDKATYAYKTNNIHNIVKHHNKAVRRQKQVDKAKEKFSAKGAFDEEGGAGEWGKKKPVRRFEKETPGEGREKVTMPDHPLWSAAKHAVDKGMKEEFSTEREARDYVKNHKDPDAVSVYHVKTGKFAGYHVNHAMNSSGREWLAKQGAKRLK